MSVKSTPEQDGDTALISAAAKGRSACVRLLLEGGAKGVKDQVRRLGYFSKYSVIH
jgi:ankyrin repeat protein